LRQLSPIKLSIFVLTLIATSTLFAHGNASAATAVDISTCVDLQKIGNDISFPLDGDYTLTGDIDCTDTVNWNANAGFIPIGSSTTPFIGTFNGQNHKITGLYINLPTTNDIGLIGYSQDATIRNLSMSGGSISGQNYVGGINGHEHSLTLSNVSSNQTIVGAYYVGGIVGWNQSNSTVDTTLSNVHFSGTLSHDASTPLNCYAFAGLIGDNDGNAVITNSSNSGNIGDINSDCDYVGGLTGDSDGNLSISNSYNTGNIGQLSSDNSIGGISGWSDNLILHNSYSTGNVTGGVDVGGLIGYVGQLNMLNSYSTGNVTGHNDVGGLAGFVGIDSTTPNYSTITNSYFSGLISSQDPLTIGGIIGLFDYASLSGLTITNTFWNSQVSSINNGCGSIIVDSVTYTCAPDGLTGLSTYKLQTALTFTDASWDLSQVWGICSTLNNGLPYLLSQGLVCAPAADAGIKAPITGFGSITTDQSGKSLDELLSGLAVLAIIGLLIPRKNRI
jgi:hypothetical protein